MACPAGLTQLVPLPACARSSNRPSPALPCLPPCLPACLLACLLQRFVEDCGEDVSVEQAPQMQGRQMNMVLGPKKIQLV